MNLEGGRRRQQSAVYYHPSRRIRFIHVATRVVSAPAKTIRTNGFSFVGFWRQTARRRDASG